MSELSIRSMRADEVPLAIDWAAAESWNPGLDDAACFATVDPGGFLIGEVGGEAVATISCVNYDPHFSFLGFYIVRPDRRGKGYGLRIWKAAIEHAGARVIGLDGVVAQQHNYEKSGFVRAYPNIRYGGIAAAGKSASADIVDLKEVALASVERFDVFPAPRSAFLRRWITAPGHVGRAILRDGEIAGWGVIRPCRKGFKIGPLVATDRKTAEQLLLALLPTAKGAEIFLDVPQVNGEAIALAEGYGLAPVFETARMYTGPIARLPLGRVFGVTTFELG